MHGFTRRINRNGDRHVLHDELVDRLHAQIGKADHTRGLDCLRDQISGATYRHQICGFVFADRLDRDRAALGLADHAEQAGFAEHLLGELVHARRGSRTGGTDDFGAHRIDRTDVVDEAPAQVDRQRLAAIQHLDDALVCSIAAGEQLPVEQQDFARLPARDFCRRDGVQIDTTTLRRVVGQLRPVGQQWRVKHHRPTTVEGEMRMPRSARSRLSPLAIARARRQKQDF